MDAEQIAYYISVFSLTDIHLWVFGDTLIARDVETGSQDEYPLATVTLEQLEALRDEADILTEVRCKCRLLGIEG